MGFNGRATNGIPAQELTQSRFRSAVDGALTAHANALVPLDTDAKTSREFTADMSARVDEHGQRLDKLKSDLEAVTIDEFHFRHRGFLQRLKWIAVGR